MSRKSRGLYLVTLVAVGVASSAGCLDWISALQMPLINVSPGLQARYIVTDAAQPAALAVSPDGRVFYTEKNTGRIRVIENGQRLDEPLATVPVNYAGDRGLLGIALHPHFNLNHRVYVFYTRSDTGAATNDPQAVVDHRVVYFVADSNVASGGEVFVASLGTEGAGERVGGRIAFAPDETLFVALGDMTLQAAAQDPTHVAGKVLRYNDDGTIPDNNPSDDSPVFASGFRFPQGVTIDPESRMVFVTDRNPDRYHEVNLVASGDNYGWPAVVGLATTDAELEFVANTPNYNDPILDSGDDTNPLVGATFNPGTKYGPETQLAFFYGLRNRGQVFALELTDNRALAQRTDNFANGLPVPLTDVAFTPAGTLWVASENAILRVDTFP